MNREITYAAAINDAMHVAMRVDESVICYGLGVTDPKGVFGTTIGLEQSFGSARVFDVPTSENALLGIAVGASLAGLKPVVTHQRLDFFLLALDQLVNAAAKWHYMFGGTTSVPITIRLIIGRGWGQGPTHSQNLHAWFSHIPGLKVVMPSTPEDAKGLLLSSIFDPNPVLFLEHRWLHGSLGSVPPDDYRIPIGVGHVTREGSDVTIISHSLMTVEALRAAKYLSNCGIECNIVDLRTIRPLDWDLVYRCVESTRRVVVLDSGFSSGSVAGEIIARLAMRFHGQLKCAPVRLAMPDISEPTSFALTKGFHVTATNIVQKVLEMFGLETKDVEMELAESHPHDVPGPWFKGPF